jgi:hypothetical protein
MMNIRIKSILAPVLVVAFGLMPTTVANGPAEDCGAQGLQDAVTTGVIDEIDPFAAVPALVRWAPVCLKFFAPLPAG